MIKKYGKVIEVFIPEEYKNGGLIDVMDSNKIGFNVLCDGEIIKVIQQQDEFNANIMKNDSVIITKQTISGKEFIDIELDSGENNE